MLIALEHLIARSDEFLCDIAYRSTAWISLKLSLIDGDVFRLPFGVASDSSESYPLPPNATFLQPYHQIRMQPPAPPKILSAHPRDIAFPTNADDIKIACRHLKEELPDYASACEQARQSVRADPRWTETARDAGSDIVVTTLGTGSALPSKYRNVSSTHLDIPDLGGILLDAGEGTLGQLRRRFGITGLRQFYETLRLIFISHMHADHHLGLQRVLEDRFAVRRAIQLPCTELMRRSAWNNYHTVYYLPLSRGAKHARVHGLAAWRFSSCSRLYCLVGQSII